MSSIKRTGGGEGVATLCSITILDSRLSTPRLVSIAPIHFRSTPESKLSSAQPCPDADAGDAQSNNRGGDGR